MRKMNPALYRSTAPESLVMSWPPLTPFGVEGAKAASKPSTKAPVRKKQPCSSLEAKFMTIWKALEGSQPTREWRFHPTRRWRFDFSWPGRHLAIEINGQIWRKGGHTTGGGIMRDSEKALEAIFLNWTVIVLTPNLVNVATLKRIKEHFRL